jgi:inorganic pyrophosphatase
MPNAVKLPHKLDRKTMTCQAVIETPKGARSKFDYDETSGLFRLAGLLPEGMSFPLDFGFFPSTRAEDGDPLDVLVLHDEPIPTGALVSIRLIGVIEADQTEQGNTVRNDRLLAVTTCSHQHERITEMEQLGKMFVDHLTKFWVNYNAVKGKTFDVRGVYGADRAADALEKATEPNAASGSA